VISTNRVHKPQDDSKTTPSEGRSPDVSEDLPQGNEKNRRLFLQIGLKGLLASTAIAAIGSKGVIDYVIDQEAKEPREIWKSIKKLDASDARYGRPYTVCYLKALNRSLERQELTRQVAIPDNEFKQTLRDIAGAFLQHYKDEPRAFGSQMDLMYIGAIAAESNVPVRELVSPEQLYLAVRDASQHELARIKSRMESNVKYREGFQIGFDFYSSITDLCNLTGVTMEQAGVPRAERRNLLFPLLSETCQSAPSSAWDESKGKSSKGLRYLLYICEVDFSEIDSLPEASLYREQYEYALKQLQAPQEDFYSFHRQAYSYRFR